MSKAAYSEVHESHQPLTTMPIWYFGNEKLQTEFRVAANPRASYQHH